MATVADTIKAIMLAYPNHFPSPLHVAVHLFAAPGNGFEWRDGQLVEEPATTPWRTDMEMSDLDRRRVRFNEDVKLVHKVLGGLPDGLRLQASQSQEDEVARQVMELEIAAEINIRRFINDNIDAISKAPVTTNIGRGKTANFHSMIDHIDLQHACGLNVPDDIQTDWAKALTEFLRWWRGVLVDKYGQVQRHDQEVPRSHWPKPMAEAHDVITATLTGLEAKLSAWATERLEAMPAVPA